MRKVYNFLSGTLAGMMLFSMNLSAFAAPPQVTVDGNNVTVNGSVELTGKDKNVTLRVLKPGKTTADAKTNPLDAFEYFTQAKTDANGNYTFDAELSGGKYTALLVADGGNYTESVTADVKAVATISTEKIGNIFSDYKNVEYICTVPYSANEDCTVAVKVTNTLDNNVIKEETKTIKAVNNEIRGEIDLTDSSVHYGIFNLDVTVDCNNVSASGKTTFSVMNAAKTLNKKMSVQTHFGYGRWESPTNNESCHYTDVGEVPRVTKLLADAGFGHIRDELRWQFYSKNTPNYADWNSKLLYDTANGTVDLWNGHKAYLEAVKDNNLDELLILGFSCKYTGGKSPTTTEQLNYFKDYCFRAATATKQYGVNSFEVWNESNLANDLTPELYVAMVKAASDGVKEANPDAKVYAGGLAYVTVPYTKDFLYWTDTVLALLKAEDEKRTDGKSYIDGWSYHIYCSGEQPENSNIPYAITRNEANEVTKYGYFTTMGDLAAAVQEKLNQYGYNNIPLVVSETGHASETKYDETYSGGAEMMQANYELRDFAMMYDKTDYVNFYNAVSKQNKDSEYERKLGLLNSYRSDSYNDSGVAYSAKPVFLAMSNFNALLANAKLLNKTVVDNSYDYEFKNQEGQTVHMLWAKEGTASYTLDKAPIALYDMYGNDIATEGTAVTLGESPIYAVTDADLSVTFKAANGEELKTLKTGEVTISLTGADKAAGKVIFVAKYNGDRLVEVTKLTADDFSTGYTTSIEEQNSRLSVFVWESLESLTPFAQDFYIEK